jgi:hypothetical protein
MKLILFFKGWAFERYFRLALAILAGIYALSTKEYSLLIITVWLGALAILNISCCGTGGCSTASPKNHQEMDEKTIQVTYEEIK